MREILFTHKVIYLKLDESIRPSWLKPGEEVPIFLDRIYRLAPGTKVLATFEYNGTNFPACIERSRGIEFAFDIDKAISDIIEEAYLTRVKPLTSRLWFDYRRIPSGIRAIIAKGLYAKRRTTLQKRNFPDWPIDKSIEVLNYLKTPIGPAGEEPIWPQGKKFAFVASHDLESKKGFEDLDRLLEIDKSFGFKACWNVVANLIGSSPEPIEKLRSAGCEIGCHGYNHDNKLAFLPEEKMRLRLENCARYISRYRIKGFRSPSLLRSPELMQQLAHIFEFDSSWPDTDSFSESGQPNGCCSIRPFFINGLLELPITMPMDVSMLFMGYSEDEMLKTWLKKLSWIKQRQGMALINVHCHRAFSLNTKVYDAYAKLLKTISEDRDCWRATPEDIATHWRKLKKKET